MHRHESVVAKRELIIVSSSGRLLGFYIPPKINFAAFKDDGVVRIALESRSVLYAGGIMRGRAGADDIEAQFDDVPNTVAFKLKLLTHENPEEGRSIRWLLVATKPIKSDVWNCAGFYKSNAVWSAK